MRILFLAKSYPIFGGVERWLADIAKSLPVHGYDCIVGLAKGQQFHLPANYRTAYPALEYIEMDGTSGAADGRRLAVADTIKRTRPDVVIPVMLADGLAGAVQFKSRFKHYIVYPVHEIAQGVGNDLAHFGKWIDRIVFVDQSGPNAYAEECRGLENRCRIIPCGVSYGKSLPRPERGAALRIGFCGRIEQVPKRVLDLIDLCKKIEYLGIDYQLDIVGEGTALATLEQAFRLRIDSGKVKLWGGRSRDELYKSFYPVVDVLVITSEWETGPLVAFEAMMNRCLVITADFSGRKENGQLIDGKNCLVFPIGDMNAAARSIEWTISHPDEAKELAANGCDFAIEYRSTEKMTECWMQLLDDLQTAKPVFASGICPEISQDRSRLRRLGMPAWLAENLRRITRRHFDHASPGEEWPYYSQDINWEEQ